MHKKGALLTHLSPLDHNLSQTLWSLRLSGILTLVLISEAFDFPIASRLKMDFKAHKTLGFFFVWKSSSLSELMVIEAFTELRLHVHQGKLGLNGTHG